VLGHLLGDETTVPPDRGIFLERTWRLRPELTAFISEAYYAGRLEWQESCARRSVEARNGLVFRPVEHTANGQLSREEAPVVLVSLASSSGEDAPRGISFVFNRNRINVATSRAQCRVELVCSPRLLEADCQTPEQMTLVNALCRFVEIAQS
jgi:hypothetical protein